MTGASIVAVKVTADVFEVPNPAVPVKGNSINLHLVSDVADPVDVLDRGQIVKARLEVIAALRASIGRGQIQTIKERGLSVSWFAHRFSLFETNIVEAAISLSVGTDGPNRGRSIARFMEISAADIARLTVVNRNPVAPVFNSVSGLAHYSGNGFLQTGLMTQSYEALSLGHSAELLLERLGRHTRRNVRLSQRIATELGLDFFFQLNPPSAATNAAIAKLAKGNKPLPIGARRLAAYERLIEGKTNRFESRLTLRNGQAVSFCRGYIEGNVAHLIYQANDPVVPRINLSLLHRFRLMEQLIAQGVTDCIFPFGCAGLLKNICAPVIIEERLVIRLSAKGIMTALILAACLPKTQISRMTREALSGALPLHFARRRPHDITGRLIGFSTLLKSGLTKTISSLLPCWPAKDGRI